MKYSGQRTFNKSFRQTFVTKQIIHDKKRKLMKPHTNQIMNEIKASIHNQQFQMQKTLTMQGIRRSLHADTSNNQTKNYNHQIIKRPNTAVKFHNSKFNKFKSYTEENQFVQSNKYVQKIHYQINQIQKISKFFKYSVDQNKNGRQLFTNKVKLLKKSKNYKQNKTNTQAHTSQLQQSRRFRKMLKTNQMKRIKTNTNLIESQQIQNIKKIIPFSKARDQDVKLLTKCITGCYYDDADQYCDSINKLELNNIKKKFITFDTLYNSMKGDRNKGIKQIKPAQVKNRSLINLVYYLQNEKTIKLADKNAIKQKMNLYQ